MKNKLQICGQKMCVRLNKGLEFAFSTLLQKNVGHSGQTAEQSSRKTANVKRSKAKKREERRRYERDEGQKIPGEKKKFVQNRRRQSDIEKKIKRADLSTR